MVNEEKFTKIKRSMARRKAVNKIKEALWNPKRVSCWCYWLILCILMLMKISLCGSLIHSVSVAFFGTAIGNIVCIIVYYTAYSKELDRQ